MQVHAVRRTSHMACLRLGDPSTVQAAAEIYTYNDGAGLAVAVRDAGRYFRCEISSHRTVYPYQADQVARAHVDDQ